MQRGIGQHKAQADCPGATVSASPFPVILGRSTMGACWLVRRDSASRETSTNWRTASKLKAISAKGLEGRLFRWRSRTASRLAASQARWNPPRPLIARILPAFNQMRVGDCLGFGRCYFPGFNFKPNLGPTYRAGHRLCMKPAVAGIFIFGKAVCAHLKASHGGFGTVVGDVLDDRKTGTAIGTVDEGIAIAAVSRVKQFIPAIGCIRRHLVKLG